MQVSLGVFFCVMHVTCMADDVYQNVTCHASVKRQREARCQVRRMGREAEAGEAVESVVQAPGHRAGRLRRVVVEDEPQPQADPDYEQMDVEH